MANQDVSVRLRLLNALKFKRDADASGKALEGVGTRASRASKSLSVMEAASTRTNRALRAGSVVARRYAVLGLGAVGFSLGEVVRRAQASESIMTRTNATIKSTHGVANVTADTIERLTNALGAYTDINYETIHQGANMVLTFTKIRNAAGKGNNIFDQTVRTVTAMTQAFHGKRSLTSTAVQVGKALQDPARGVSALRRVGVNFNTTQQQMLVKLVKTGHQLQAQKYILHELNKEFPLTRGTPWNRLVTQFDRLQVILGKALIPYMDKGAVSMAKLVSQFNKGEGEGGKIRDTLEHVGKAGVTVARDLTPLLHVVEKYRKPLADVAGAWIAISLGMGAVKKLSGPLGKVLGKGVGGAATKFLGERGSPKNPMYVVVLNGGGKGAPLPGNPGSKKAEEGALKKALRKTGAVAKWFPEAFQAGAAAAGAVGAVTGRFPKWAPGIGGQKITDNAFTFGHSTMPHADLRSAGASKYGPKRQWLTPAERSLTPVLNAGLTRLHEQLGGGMVTPDVVIKFQPLLDGRVLAESVHRHSVKAKALR